MLPDTGEGPKDKASRIRACASSIMSTIKMGRLQKKSTNLIQVKIALATKAVSLHWPLLPGRWRSVDFHRNLHCRDTALLNYMLI